MAQYERQTARKCRIGHILEGNYIQREGWEPSYVETSVGRVSRANLMGVIVGDDGDSLVLDDGSGRISLRTFGQADLSSFEVGDKVLVIARPRVYNDEKYLAAEIVRKIENDKWLEYRRREIEVLPRVEVRKKEPVQKVETETVSGDAKEEEARSGTGEEILERIRELDDGKGADIEEVVEGFDRGEKIMNSLMEEGEVFEIRPGKVKVLE